MSFNVKKYLLEDVITIFNSQRIPLSSRERVSRQGIYPYYGAQGIIDYIDGYIFDGEYILVAEDGENLVSKKQQIANLAKGKFWVNNHAHIIRNNDNSDFKYLYYLLNFIDISSYVTGSAQPKLSKGNLNKIAIELPSLSVQTKVAAFLSALDDKIELNNRMNKVLEQMAQAIFKQWFVDFEFPNENGEPYKSCGGEMEWCEELGKEIPKGWKYGKIGDYVSVKSGYAFKSSWWQETGIPVIKIKDIDNNTINFSDVSYVAEDKVDAAKEFLVQGGDLLIAMTGATLGKYGIVPPVTSKVLVNQRVGKFFLGDRPTVKLGFIFGLLSREEVFNVIVSKGDGSAQPNISPSAIEGIRVIYPDNDLIVSYNSLVKDYFEKMLINIRHNLVLSNLRNTLLPKLMSGEIDVSEIEL